MKTARFPTLNGLGSVILHTFMHHLSTSTYMPNFIEIEETLWTDGRTFETSETSFIRSTLSKSGPKHPSSSEETVQAIVCEGSPGGCDMDSLDTNPCT